MKKLLKKHISRPYAMVIMAALLFGFVMTGLIPIGNGYIINAECTENGKFIAHTGTGCGGFSVFGMDHFLWHPRVTIAVGVVLLIFEAVAWAALLFSVMLLVPLLRELEFRRNPFKGKRAAMGYMAVILGLLFTIHFAASPVRSELIAANIDCSSGSTAPVCDTCPGVVPQSQSATNPVRQNYGWPFHMTKKTFAADACGVQPQLVRATFDPIAVVFNIATWSILSYAVMHWVASRPRLYRLVPAD